MSQLSSEETNKGQFLQKIKPILILSGWWPVDELKNLISRKYSKWFLGIHIGVFMALPALVAVHITDLIRVENKTEALGGPLAIAISSFTLIIKLTILKITNFPNLIKKIKLEEKQIGCTKDKAVFYVYTQSANIVKKVILWNAYVFSLVFVIQNIVGVIKYLNNIKSASSDREEAADKPILSPFWLPFKERDHIVFVFLINFVFWFIGCIMYYTFYFSLATFLIFTITLFKMVQVRIKHLDTTIIESKRKICPYKYLIQIAREHLYAIEFVNRLNGFIKYAVLVDFFFNSLNLASIIVQILTVTRLKDIFFPVAYALNMLVQILGMGYLSNEVKVQSFAVAETLYQTNWYNRDVRFRRVLLLMMVRAQRPLTISIGPFGAMTHETVLGTLKAAYTYITLMYNK